MMGIKLNAAQAMITNLQSIMMHWHEKSLPPTGARRRMELEYQDWARLLVQGRGPRRWQQLQFRRVPVEYQ